ncbi:Eco57I restriction-modification methylase domain-containing protein [Niabella hirudinis]|uniref:Eco57I restriction-modification methylase domain-containing protein n=1 Tax=Niabella hirudinis TaxID=1285929 RepID=UPI003EBBEAB0
MAAADGTGRPQIIPPANYHRTNSFFSAKSFSKVQAFRANILALEALHQLNQTRCNATPQEQEILARYVGFGGLKEMLLDPAIDAEWKTQNDLQLRPYVQQVNAIFQRLDPDGSLDILRSARRSILNAHFTDYAIINGVYSVLEKTGFKGGNILEPAAGVGNFLAAMPPAMASASQVTAVEMDAATGMILQKLFPTANTYINRFEKQDFPPGQFDLVISNVPFGETPVFDPGLANLKDNSWYKACSNIHNYFFAKSLLLLKPGGIMAMITSRYTMDSAQNSNIRSLMAEKAAFLGAIRLPDTAFKVNAGTEVVADIIFLQKPYPGEALVQNHAFQHIRSEPFTDTAGVNGMLSYNEYFFDHPGHLLGQKEFGGLYSKDAFNLKGDSTIDLFKSITSLGEKLFPEPVVKQHSINLFPVDITGDEKQVLLHTHSSEFDIVGNLIHTDNGVTGTVSSDYYIDEALDERVKSLGLQPHQIRMGQLSEADLTILETEGIDPADFRIRVIEPVRISKADQPKVKEIVQIRRLAKELLFKEMNHYSGEALRPLRKELLEAYRRFTRKFGNLLHKSNEKLLMQDTDCFMIRSLEKKDKLTGKITPSDILFKRTIAAVREVDRVDNVQDAITLSLQKYGRLDMNYICELMELPFESLIQSQKGDETLIFQDMDGSFKTRDEYLSGQVVNKLQAAREQVAMNPAFLNNVEQLEKVQPRPIPMVDIYCPLHARWIPKADVQAFISDLLHTEKFDLIFSSSLDTYTLTINDKTAQSEAFRSKRKSAAWIINHSLNGVEPIVKYTDKDEEGREIIVFDPQDTHFAKELYKKVKNAWDEFKLSDPERRRELEAIYNKLYNTTVLRNYDGSHLLFPGLSGFTLRPHQKDAVFRNVQQLGGINDHKVGAGKTLVQICTAMELRRLGICNKPMIIGIKSQVPQLYESFKKAYPLSKVLFPSEKDFQRENRLHLLNTIATNDWDCIILSHDQFNLIRQPINIQEAIIEELKKEIEKEMYSTDDKALKKKLETQLYNYEQKLERLNNQKKDSQVSDFSQLGIDFLMVDESQEYKNLEFLTRKRNIKGLGNPLGSKRAFNMLIACCYLQDLHGDDKGILFSSGTTISNSMAEFYLLMKYLRPDYMKKIGLNSFDRWAANFANDFSELEYYMGRFKEVHRFREFTNLPELITMYREIADVRNEQNLRLDIPKASHNLIKVKPSEVQLAHIQMLQQYIDSKGVDYAETLGLTAGYDPNKKINPSFAILAINYARKLSLDPRLINNKLPPGTKLEEAADDIAALYHGATHFKGTQFVFCDLGTPKSRNQVDNLYDFLEGDIPDADLHEIFGENYYDLPRKPSIEIVKDKLAGVLKLSYDEADKLILEANTAENFNVYDELKRLLAAKGVAEPEIAFAHNYNTRRQKETLYEQINAGEIRVAIGSTKKLGVGVNAQERCIAGHHIDIPWRPSDLEQRNGRFERPGNLIAKTHLGNKVQAFYYATERTLDASMYNTVGLKAHFISQVKLSANQDVRIAKDVEEDVDMSQMAAELSGDPIFKEKATLTKKITELEQLNRSWLHKRLSTEDNLKQAVRLKEHYEQKIDVLKITIPLLDDLPKKNGEHLINARVGNDQFDKIGEFGKAMLREGLYQLQYKKHGQEFELGTLWGFKVAGIVENNIFNKHINRQVLSPAGEKIGAETKLPEGEMAIALQVKNIILGMPEELTATEKKLVDSCNNILEYQKQLMDDNPYKADLMYCQQRLAEIDRLIVKRAENEKKQNQNAAETQQQVALSV